MSGEGRLYVGGLSCETEADELRGPFGKYGAIGECVVITDRDTGDSLGFGFVTYENPEDAKGALKGLHRTDLNGSTIRVRVPTEGGEVGGRGGGGYRSGGAGGSYGGSGRYSGQD